MASYQFRKLSSVVILSIVALIVMKTTTIAVPARQPSCRSVSGLSALLKRGNILLFGELHGTQEVPAFIADVVCIAAKKRAPVILGLEIPSEEQAAIDRFLDSGGGPAAEARLTEGAFWHPKLQDGRPSVAMLHLIEQVRALRASGYKVRIVAYDSKPGTPSQERDRVMAQNLTAVAGREPGNLLVVLSGNVHNRLTRGVSWSNEYEPMGYLLTKSISSSRIVSLNMSHAGGEAWGCRSPTPDSDEVTCAPYSYRPQAGSTAWSVKLTAAPDTAFSGTYGVGRITSSPPVAGQTR
jgi:hypothetical protein